jgi:hypothetical protein
LNDSDPGGRVFIIQSLAEKTILCIDTTIPLLINLG